MHTRRIKLTELIAIGIGIVLIAAFNGCSGENSSAKDDKQEISNVSQAENITGFQELQLCQKLQVIEKTLTLMKKGVKKDR